MRLQMSKLVEILKMVEKLKFSAFMTSLGNGFTLNDGMGGGS